MAQIASWGERLIASATGLSVGASYQRTRVLRYEERLKAAESEKERMKKEDVDRYKVESLRRSASLRACVFVCSGIRTGTFRFRRSPSASPRRRSGLSARCARVSARHVRARSMRACVPACAHTRLDHDGRLRFN